MYEYIKIQYKLYLLDNNSIDLNKIQQLADLYLTSEEKEEIFGN